MFHSEMKRGHDTARGAAGGERWFELEAVRPVRARSEAAQRWVQRVTQADWQKQECALKWLIALGNPLCCWLPLNHRALEQIKYNGVSLRCWEHYFQLYWSQRVYTIVFWRQQQSLWVLPCFLDWNYWAMLMPILISNVMLGHLH